MYTQQCYRTLFIQRIQTMFQTIFLTQFIVFSGCVPEFPLDKLNNFEDNPDFDSDNDGQTENQACSFDRSLVLFLVAFRDPWELLWVLFDGLGPHLEEVFTGPRPSVAESVRG